MKALPGSPHPLGATWDGQGVNFALFSANAEAVELCLFDEQGNETRVPLTQRTAFVWHGYISGLVVGEAIVSTRTWFSWTRMRALSTAWRTGMPAVSRMTSAATILI